MEVIIVLISVSLIVAIAFLIAFLWSVKSGQYEDRYTPSVRILFDEEKEVKNENQNKSKEEK
jgi:cbb3-type cytochrome oxidase maturation protein